MTDDPAVIALRADIAQHRADLAASIDALAEKLDVKAKVRAKAGELKPYAVPAAAAVTGIAVLIVVLKRRRA